MFSTLETIPYVYRLTDKVNGKRYIGCRLAEGCNPGELGISYFTSSEIVEPLFSNDPGRFEKQIITTGNQDYVYKVETSLLKMYSAAESDDFYNMHNNDNLINPVKAAMVTATRGSGVHARTKEQMTLDSMKMVNKHRTTKTGIFAPGVAEKGRQRQKELGIAAFNTENRSKGGVVSGNNAKLKKTGIHSPNFDKSSAAKKMHLTKYKCEECNLIGAATSLALHQKSSKHVGKILITKG